ncbi:signal transduction family protein (GGDEF domain protein) [Desulforapulum autotrophicum HRM2]|uniref:diguanylate cyclase n=1 Tax=Desulforapulum autotrophicum (strain ATCC 43914 / DSM 3382 / VKM B-1955 / HRM2) TaxID=177437 RepID=C0QFG9_DESAH|nr:GGDEF domain-containing protein [Desulforapulum autotrophicum]ACN13365.1 signal transduction family protein (GGDEF domain protein) [Desulforapulum autotrophicum HRM2]
MLYNEDKNQAGEYLRLSLGFIAKYNLPADPACYSVWYQYIAGKNPHLKAVLDYIIKNEKQITVNTIKKLYKDHILEKDRTITENLLQELRIVINGISRYAIDTTGDIAGNGKRLQALVRELEEDEDMDSLARTMDKIIQEAKALVQTGKSFQGRMASSSQELASLRKKLDVSKKDAETDALTGLLNRRGFESRLHPLLKDPQSCFCLIMIDIDHFKRVNDTYGHLVGDSILKALANLLKQQTKGKDCLARFGGEEFIILLPETRLEQAGAVAEDIRKKLAAQEWKQRKTGKPMGKITISLGVTQYRPNESEVTLIHRVDTALYTAKRNGRNRVVTEEMV